MSELQHEQPLAQLIATRANVQFSDVGRWRRRLRVTAAIAVTDYAVILLAVASGLSLDALLRGPGGAVALDAWLVMGPLIAIIWGGALELYRSRERHVVGNGSTEYARITTATSVATGLIAVLLLLWHVDVGRGAFLMSMPIGLGALLIERNRWRHWLGSRPELGRGLSRALIVGAREDVGYVAAQLRRSAAAYSIVGAAVEDDLAGGVATENGVVPVVGALDNVAELVRRHDVETVIVASTPPGGSAALRRLSWSLEGAATELVLASQLTDVAGPRIHFRPLEGMPLIHVEIPRFEGPRHTMKRAFDIVASAFALLVLSPLLLLLAMLVRADSSGGAIFKQERVGRNGERFEIFKFRSMSTDAEARLVELETLNEASGPLFKLRDDPRVTRVGKVLRRYSLDELPQFWNVFKGDMSIVGPRPPLPKEVETYEGGTERRLYIKPGLTGMWQVSGRSDLEWEEGVRLDLYYVENWSLIGDLRIIWRTVKIMLHPVGAY
jgi:exopolysaccharide biosynthesis polyprenyl glycosylphosphotransferase